MHVIVFACPSPGPLLLESIESFISQRPTYTGIQVFQSSSGGRCGGRCGEWSQQCRIAILYTEGSHDRSGLDCCFLDDPGWRGMWPEYRRASEQAARKGSWLPRRGIGCRGGPLAQAVCRIHLYPQISDLFASPSLFSAFRLSGNGEVPRLAHLLIPVKKPSGGPGRKSHFPAASAFPVALAAPNADQRPWGW